MADGAPASGLTILAPDDEHVPVLDAPVGAPSDDGIPVLPESPDTPVLPPRAVLNGDRTVTYTLAEPVTLRYRSAAGGAVREEAFASFTFRRLRGADMRKVSDAEAGDRSLLLLSIATDTPLPKMILVYDRMDAADATAMGEVAGFLLGIGRKTGR